MGLINWRNLKERNDLQRSAPPPRGDPKPPRTNPEPPNQGEHHERRKTPNLQKPDLRHREWIKVQKFRLIRIGSIYGNASQATTDAFPLPDFFAAFYSKILAKKFPTTLESPQGIVSKG